MSRKQAIVVELQVIKALKNKRLELGLSHEKLAQECGLSRSAISLMESGKRHPTLLTCLRVALALNAINLISDKFRE